MKPPHEIAEDIGEEAGEMPWADELIADVERHLRLRAEFEQWCRDNGREATL